MEKTLVIVESPAKAKSIGKFLGKKYFVKASMGHVRDLPKSQLGVNPEQDFLPKYITIRGKGEIIKELKAAVKKADNVLLASDPDREGEAIAWHLVSLLDLDPGKKCRVEFNEITKNTIQDAVKSPRPIDLNLVNAQQARRILDRLVGYNLSPLLWKKVKKGLSAGRVQSVAVRLICDREEEIQAFVSEEYWSLTARLARDDAGQVFEAKLFKVDRKKAEIPDETNMQAIIQDLKGARYTVAGVVRREKLRQPLAPFITSTLQQEAYRKLNFVARKTMAVAQQLYEGIELGKEGPVGLVTYIRTDSTRVSESARMESAQYIMKRFGKQYVYSNTRPTTAKQRVQDAHEAIRPTSVAREPESVKGYLTGEQYKLYRLIWARFLASQMSPAVIDTTTVEIKAGRYIFRSTGAVVKFTGFTQVYTESRDNGEEDENGALPLLSEGDRLIKKALLPRQHFTQPPPRYTDATLIRALEEKGIGRPSTYAPIVETILKRDYVYREKKQFNPTELGMVVVNLLKEYFPDIIDVQFTAAVEDKLDNIEGGEYDWAAILKDFYIPFKKMLAKAEKEVGQFEVADQVSEELCDICSRPLVYKMGRFGKFLACPGFPECRFTKPIVEPTGVDCPLCEGTLVMRRSKKGRVFYGCSRYPQCSFTTWDRPAPEKCPVCGSIMVYKKIRGNEELRCSSPECGKVKGGDEAKAKKSAGAKDAGKAVKISAAGKEDQRGNSPVMR